MTSSPGLPSHTFTATDMFSRAPGLLCWDALFPVIARFCRLLPSSSSSPLSPTVCDASPCTQRYFRIVRRFFSVFLSLLSALQAECEYVEVDYHSARSSLNAELVGLAILDW